MNGLSFIGVPGNSLILFVVGEIYNHLSSMNEPRPLQCTHSSIYILYRRILFPRNLFGQNRDNDSKQETDIKRMKFWVAEVFIFYLNMNYK